MYETDILSLLKKHSYAAVVRRVDEDSCTLTMPHNAFLRSSPPETMAFAILRGRGGEGILFNSDLDDSELTVPVPEYAARLFIQSSIANACGLIGMDPEWACYEDADGTPLTNLEGVLAGPSTEDGVSKELTLLRLCGELRRGSPAEALLGEAADLGVEDGFALCASNILEV